MRPFGVMLEGTWSEKWSDIAGFFTTRIVLADGAEEAVEIVKRRITQELQEELPGCPEPSVRIDEIWEAEADQLLEKQSGFTFYSEPD